MFLRKKVVPGLSFLAGFGEASARLVVSLMLFYLAQQELEKADTFSEPLGDLMLASSILGVLSSLPVGRPADIAVKGLKLIPAVAGFVVTRGREFVGAVTTSYVFAGALMGGTLVLLGTAIYKRKRMSVADGVGIAADLAAHLCIAGFMTTDKDWNFNVGSSFNEILSQELSVAHKVELYSACAATCVVGGLNMLKTVLPKHLRVGWFFGTGVQEPKEVASNYQRLDEIDKRGNLRVLVQKIDPYKPHLLELQRFDTALDIIDQQERKNPYQGSSRSESSPALGRSS